MPMIQKEGSPLRRTCRTLSSALMLLGWQLFACGDHGAPALDLEMSDVPSDAKNLRIEILGNGPPVEPIEHEVAPRLIVQLPEALRGIYTVRVSALRDDRCAN